MGGDLNPLVVTVLTEKRTDTDIMSKKSDFFGAGWDSFEQSYFIIGEILCVYLKEYRPFSYKT